MLRVNVGLSRKLSKDYNSTGYSVNLDGEVTAAISDPEAVIEQVKELFDLAEEALSQQIERANGEAAIASRDQQEAAAPPTKPTRRDGSSNGYGQRAAPRNGENSRTDEQPATEKQINYLLNIGKRQRLITAQLEAKIAEILGRPVGIYDLSKTSAGVVIDALTGQTGNGKANARN